MASAKTRHSDERDAWREPKILYDEDAERSVLGAVLADAGMFPQLAAHLCAGDFYLRAHRVIWEAVAAIAAEGCIPDELTVREWLERHGRFAEAGGMEGIAPLTTGVPPNYPHAATGWARILLEHSESRVQYDLGCAYVQTSQYPLDAAPRAEIVRQQARLEDIQRRLRGEVCAAPAFTPLGVSMADVAVEEFEWLWHGRVAFGKLATFDGDGGLGKSLATIDLVTRAVMCRPMPDGSPGLAEPGSAILICGEDGLADTVMPRLLAAGVSPDAMHRIRAINLVPEPLASGEVSQRLLSLLDDLPQLEATIEALGARVLVIDPITAYLGDGIDMYKDAQVRRVLTPLALMAERRHLAVVMTRHLNRSNSASAQHRGLGSVAFLNVARLGLLFAPNPDAEGEVLVSRYKGNITATPPTMAYRIVQVGEAENMPRLQWLGERETSAETALAAQMGASADRETRTATDEATDWLRDYLANRPHHATEVVDDAIAAGIIPDRHHDKPLRNARQRLGIRPYRDGGIGESGRWMWRYDATSPTEGQLREDNAPGAAAKSESNGDPAKIPNADNEGHLSADVAPKMPSKDDTGHLSTNAELIDDADASELPGTLKLPSQHEKGIYVHDQRVCKATGGNHIYHMQRTFDGRSVCTECDEPAVPIGG